MSQEYTPMMSAEDVERIQRWHEAASADNRAAVGTQRRTFEYLGLTLVVPPQVQPIFPVSHLLGEAVVVEVRPDDAAVISGETSRTRPVRRPSWRIRLRPAPKRDAYERSVVVRWNCRAGLAPA